MECGSTTFVLLLNAEAEIRKLVCQKLLVKISRNVYSAIAVLRIHLFILIIYFSRFTQIDVHDNVTDTQEAD